jgi:hypothetical protein
MRTARIQSFFNLKIMGNFFHICVQNVSKM